MSKLDESIKCLIEFLREENDSNLQEALAIMLNVKDYMRECSCGNRHDRECEYCRNPLCDDCDRGTIRDECSVCSDCKDSRIWFD